MSEWARLLQEELNKEDGRPEGGKTFEELLKELGVTEYRLRSLLKSLISQEKAGIVSGSEYCEKSGRKVRRIYYVIK